jgi:hypothetical protein
LASETSREHNFFAVESFSPNFECATPGRVGHGLLNSARYGILQENLYPQNKHRPTSLLFFFDHEEEEISP